MKFRLRWLDNSFVWIRSKALGSKVGGDPTFGQDGQLTENNRALLFERLMRFFGF